MIIMATIFAARSEYRSNSLTAKALPLDSDVPGIESIELSNTLEEITGADMIISPLSHPSLDTDDEKAFRTHLLYGCKLMQIKHGYDLLSSVDDDRLYRSINKMKTIGAVNPQCILLPILVYKEKDGTLFINGRRAGGNYGNHKSSAIFGIFTAWTDHGGVVMHLPSPKQLPQYLSTLARAFDKPGNKVLYPHNDKLTMDMVLERDKPLMLSDVLRSDELITDLRVLINSIPNLGPIKSHKIWEAAGGTSATAQSILDFVMSDSIIDLPGFGKKSVENIRGFLCQK